MKLAQVRQPTASKNQFRPVNFHDFCYTILTKILNILDSNLCIPNPKFEDWYRAAKIYRLIDELYIFSLIFTHNDIYYQVTSGMQAYYHWFLTWRYIAVTDI